MASPKDLLFTRRTVLKTLALGVAGGCSGRRARARIDGSVDAAVDASDGGPSDLPDGGTTTPPVQGKHRFQKFRLFQRAHAKVDPFVYTNSLGETVHSSFHDVHYDLVPGVENCHRMVGASAQLICAVSKWPWKNAKGDYVGLDGQAQSAVPFVSRVVSSAEPAGVLVLDATSAFRHIEEHHTWAALLLKVSGAGTLSLTGVLHPTAPKSRVELVFEDDSTETLSLWYTSSTLTSTAYLNAHEDVIPVSSSANGLIEFDRKDHRGRGLRSATLHLEHSGCGAMTLSVYVISPEIPDLTPIPGIAASAPLDGGLASHPDIIFSQVITDRSVIEDVLDTRNSGSFNYPYVPGSPPLSQRQEAFFDPTLWGQPALPPAETATRLPHRNLGKWVGTTFPENNEGRPSFTVVHSDYAAHDFVPLAPGLGAVHLTMPKRAPLNGQTWRVDGESGTDVDLWLPYDKIGRVRRIRFRYYLLLGAGWEARDDSMAFHFIGNQIGKWPEELGYTTTDSLKTLVARPSDNSGKMFGGAQHVTSTVVVAEYNDRDRLDGAGNPDDSMTIKTLGAGYGASSGGDIGYQGRMLWSGGFHKQLGGPAEGGLTLGMHLYDMQNTRMPASLMYIKDWDSGFLGSFSQRGGLGHIFKDGRWRCVEFEWMLNPNEPYALPPRGTNVNESGFDSPPTGYLRAWVDGVLASTTPNFGFTRLPKINWDLQADAGAPFDTDPGSPARFRPITNVTDEQYLGFASLAGNLYYGGRSPCPVERHVFLNGITVAMDDAYIGPMAGVAREHGGLG